MSSADVFETCSVRRHAPSGAEYKSKVQQKKQEDGSTKINSSESNMQQVTLLPLQ